MSDSRREHSTRALARRVREALRRATPALPVRFGLIFLLALFITVLISPGLSGPIARYQLGQFTSAAIRAPYDFSVIDAAATERRREEAFRGAIPVAVLDAKLPGAIKAHVADAFASVRRWFAQAELMRQVPDAELRKLSPRRQAALKQRRARDADRFLEARLEQAVPSFEGAVGLQLSPAERVLLIKHAFGDELVLGQEALIDDISSQPVARDLPSRRPPGRWRQA